MLLLRKEQAYKVCMDLLNIDASNLNFYTYWSVFLLIFRKSLFELSAYFEILISHLNKHYTFSIIFQLNKSQGAYIQKIRLVLLSIL